MAVREFELAVPWSPPARSAFSAWRQLGFLTGEAAAAAAAVGGSDVRLLSAEDLDGPFLRAMTAAVAMPSPLVMAEIRVTSALEGSVCIGISPPEEQESAPDTLSLDMLFRRADIDCAS